MSDHRLKRSFYASAFTSANYRPPPFFASSLPHHPPSPPSSRPAIFPPLAYPLSLPLSLAYSLSLRFASYSSRPRVAPIRIEFLPPLRYSTAGTKRYRARSSKVSPSGLSGNRYLSYFQRHRVESSSEVLTPPRELENIYIYICIYTCIYVYIYICKVE